jgi:HSP20 family molecular chaperone IbpA
MPGIFGEDLMDRWFDDMDREFARMEKPLYGHNAKNLMKTDVREHDDGYEVDIELPGFHKDEVQLSLENGYLNITAAKGLDKDEKDKKSGKLIRQERYAGSMSRSFYVGDIRPESIKCKYEDGVLTLTFPKAEQPKLPETHSITIE